MKVKIERKWKKDTYTIGNVYINGLWFCNSLEDKDRGLTSKMSEEEIFDVKVKGETAIPSGLYNLAYTYSPKLHKYAPLVLNVKGFSGIRIHSGNTDKDSEGCIILGLNKKKGEVINSRYTCNNFYHMVEDALDKGQLVTLEIV